MSTQPPTILPTIVSTGVTANSAVLFGVVEPMGSDTTCHFEWKPVGGTSSVGPDIVIHGTPSLPWPVEQSISSLQPSTTYRFRVVATNAGGTTDSPVLEFTTAPQHTTGLSAVVLTKSGINPIFIGVLDPGSVPAGATITEVMLTASSGAA